MQKIEKFIKKTGIISIMESFIFIILGIILVCEPQTMVKFISIILISIFSLVGIFKLVSYFISRGKNDLHNYDLIYGLMAIVLGIVVFIYIDVIGSIFRIIIGIWIIYTSFVRLNSSLQMRRMDLKLWFYSLVASILIFACGLYIILNSHAIIVTIGIVMIIYSILDLIANIMFMVSFNKLKKGD